LVLPYTKSPATAFDACLKAEGRYDITAFTDYSEIEKSADHLFTCLMTPDMKNTNQMRLQHLKNRDGPVIADPVEIYIDFKHGLRVSDTKERTATEMQLLMHTMVV
jgi:hypothetical protein